MSAVFKRALADGRSQLIGLSIGLILFVLVTMSFFPSMRDQGALMAKMMPSFMRTMMGNRAPWSSAEGFASWEYTHPIAIAICVAFALSTAGSAIAGGIERGTLGLVLAAPISRTRYYFARVGSMIAGLAIVQLVLNGTFAAMFLALHLPPRAGLAGLALAFGNGLLVYAAIGALALMVSAFAREAGRVYSIAIAFTVVAVFLNLFADMFEKLKPLKGLSLFAYYKPYEALRGIPFQPADHLIPSGVLLLALVIGWQAFARRDLPI